MRTAETARRPVHGESSAFVHSHAMRSTCGCRHAPPASSRFAFDRVSVLATPGPVLELSQPGDATEREADRVADEILRMPAAEAISRLSSGTVTRVAVARKCHACAEEDEHGPQALDPTEQEREEEGGGLAVDLDMPLPDEVREGPEEATPLALVPGPGAALTPDVRGFFESRFGFSFDRVRVHTGGQAAAVARSLDALAYTTGQDIVFGDGQYQPETPAGRRLLAHELTHVVQQNASLSRGAGPAVAARPSAVGRAVVQRWTTSGTAPTNTNTIVCDGSGGVRVQVGNAGTATQAACLTSCIRTHEQSHRSDALGANANICDGKADQIQVTFSNETERRASEHAAYTAEIDCLNGERPSASDTCKPIIDARITQITPIRDGFA